MKPVVAIVCCLLGFLSCQHTPEQLASIYKYIQPRYNLVALQATADTTSLKLEQNTYNLIKSFNVFSLDSIDYFSFYDERSSSVNIYNFQSRALVKRIGLERAFAPKKLYKTSVYVRNFDTIYVTNNSKIYLLDSTGSIKRAIPFLKSPKMVYASFENTNHPVTRKELLYVGVRPYVKETSLSELKDWKVLYGFDLQNKKTSLYYHLPEIYQDNYYGYHFLDYNYCYNNKGNFVYSFPADTNIYETDLVDRHIAYYAKSRFQTMNIAPIAKEVLEKNEGYKEYKLRDSYGPIFFDPHKKRYLRFWRKKMSETEAATPNGKRLETVIIFNEDFKIIGESEITTGISFSSLFFTSNGNIYARINSGDEYALHFLQLTYTE